MIKYLKGLMKKKKPETVPVDSSASDALKELEESLKALNDLLTNSGIKVQGYDDFIKQSSSVQIVPFTTIENYNDAAKELSHHKSMHSMLTDYDIVEELLSFHNKGYEFSGFKEIYNKLEQNEDLSKEERKKIENWYVLVGMELVYNV